MKPHNFTLRELQYLTVLAEEKHMGRAAERCFVSQPTMSAQLKRLEQQLGVTLFERAPKKMRLTAVGEVIAAKATELLNSANQLQETAEYFHDPLRGELKVGVIPTIGPYLLPELIRHCRQAMPALNIHWHEAQTKQLVMMLDQGDLDVAILAFPVALAGFIAECVFVEPFWAVFPPSHALLAKASVSLEDISGEALLLLEEGHCLRDHALAVCELTEKPEIPDTRATSLETLRSLVGGGYGMSLFPQMAIGDDENVRPISSIGASRQIGLAYRAGSAKKEAIKLLGVCMRDSAGNLLKGKR